MRTLTLALLLLALPAFAHERPVCQPEGQHSPWCCEAPPPAPTSTTLPPLDCCDNLDATADDLIDCARHLTTCAVELGLCMDREKKPPCTDSAATPLGGTRCDHCVLRYRRPIRVHRSRVIPGGQAIRVTDRWDCPVGTATP